MSVRVSVVGLCALLLLPSTVSWAADAPAGLVKARDRGVRVLQPGESALGDAAHVASGGKEPGPATLVVNTGPSPDAPKPLVPNAFVVTPATHAVIKPCDRPFTAVDMAVGAKRFDHDLSAALQAGRTVVVDVAQPYDQGGPAPASLAPWLSAAKAGGGAVRVSPYCSAGRGVFKDWLADVAAHLTGAVYRPARGYDVTLYADATRRQVTQVRFQPRSASLAAN